MPPYSAERRIRRRLSIVRFMQSYVPLSLAVWLNRQGARCVRLTGDVKRESASADSVPCDWIIPQNGAEDQVLLYLHGGGFVFGQTPVHIPMVAYLAQKMGVRSLMVDYRLGPRQPFPAALDDCVTAYCWLLKQGFPARNIVLAGDSAGGNLAIAMMMKLRDSGEPLPAAAACLSPAADLSAGSSALQARNDPLIPPTAARMYSTAYVAHNDACNPLISPVFGDWRGLPPLLIHAGEDELLRDDANRIGELARAAGVDVRVEIYPRMWHVWQVFLELPQAQQSLGDIAEFLQTHLQK